MNWFWHKFHVLMYLLKVFIYFLIFPPNMTIYTMYSIHFDGRILMLRIICICFTGLQNHLHQKQNVSASVFHSHEQSHVYGNIFMPPPFEEWWRGIKCYPCLSVRSSVRASGIKIWCPLNNFWKTASIQFKFGMLIFYIKTQVEFNLGYNPLIFDRVMGLL